MSLPWSLVCVLCVWGFVICTIGFILQGFPARGVLAVRPCFRWGAALLVCFACWLVGMANA
jgi:hypothetical protein